MPIKLSRKLPALAGDPRQTGDQPVPTPTKLLTVKETATFAVVSTLTVRRWLKAGFLRAYRAGHQIRIDKDDLVKFLSQ